ncbi:MAG: hypothetical protein ACI4O5_03640 [Oscillospiraceae bacterium]
MKKRKVSFRLIYLIYLGVLAALVLSAVLYVGSLLRRYENSQPERRVWEAAAALAADASQGDFWSKYTMPEVTPGRFEQGRAVQEEYLALYNEEELSINSAGGTHPEDELLYNVENGGLVLAQVKLKAAGPPVTKLAVFSMREWAVESVRPVLEAHDYTLTVPSDFGVQVNGVALSAADGAPKDGNETGYTVTGLYLKPEFTITDANGDPAQYTVKNGRVLVEYFNYSLTLPSALTVEVNGAAWPGETVGEDRVRYDIVLLTKPTVSISDDYGNTVSYEGGDKLPLTALTITADGRYTVQVGGEPVPERAVIRYDNPDYATFADYVQDLPQVCDYHIAVLRDDAEITVTDEAGKPVALDPEQSAYDFTQPKGLETVPEEVSAQVDVLRVAQDWSLFMSNDLAVSKIKPYLISTSYQYQVAVRYAASEDSKFFSKHTLASPAFTDSTVTNFVWITDDCFSVDISFVKHMRLYYGAPVDDPMNDRFYFVRYDDTNDGVDNPAWKLAGMKEIIHDAGV